jgi:hypothetical protein
MLKYMKKNNKIVFNENIFYMFLILLAGIILIGLIIYDLKNSDTFSEDKKKNILYIEIFLSFIASSVLLLWMTYFLRGDFIPPLFIIIYSLVLILTTPFSLLIIRSFLQNKSYIKIISILTIISTLFSMYFTYGAAIH